MKFSCASSKSLYFMTPNKNVKWEVILWGEQRRKAARECVYWLKDDHVCIRSHEKCVRCWRSAVQAVLCPRAANQPGQSGRVN